MRVSFAVWSTGLEGGGGVRAIFEIANRLSKTGHKVSIIALGGDHVWFPLKVQVNYVGLPIMTKIVSPLFSLRHKRPMKLLDIRFTKLGSSLHLDLMKSLSEGIPDCDINVATWFPTAIAVWLSGKGRLFYLMQDFYEQMKSADDRSFDQRLFKATLGLSMYFLTNSIYTRGLVLEVQPTAKVKVVGAGVNLEVFCPRKRRIVDSRGLPIVMVVVRSEPTKQADLAIKVLNYVNKTTPIHAVLVGEIPKNARVDFHFSLYKRITDNELAELYSASDLFLFTSSVEGFALPPLEAMACGTPVVTTDCKGNRDYATDGFNCLIAPPQDKEQLARHIMDMLKKEKLREQLVEGGLETAKRFTWDHVVDKFETAIKENT